MNYATPHSLQVDSRLSGKIPASESFRVGPCTVQLFKPLHSQSFAWPSRISLSSFDVRGQYQRIWDPQALCISSLPNSFIIRARKGFEASSSWWQCKELGGPIFFGIGLSRQKRTN